MLQGAGQVPEGGEQIVCEEANDQIYKFEGTLYMPSVGRVFALSNENLILRGSSLRNTAWALGVIVYTGH